PPAPPEPDAREPRRRTAPLRAGHRSRDEPRPARAAAQGALPGRRAQLLAGPRPADLPRRAGDRPDRRDRRPRRRRCGMTETTTGLTGVPIALTPLNRKDYASDAEVRWCPG